MVTAIPEGDRGPEAPFPSGKNEWLYVSLEIMNDTDPFDGGPYGYLTPILNHL